MEFKNLGQFKRKKVIVGIGLIFLLAVLGSDAKGSMIAGFFSSRVISVIPPSPSVPPEAKPLWTILEKINEAHNLLKNISLKVGDRDINYTESRYASVNGKIITASRSFKEPEKEIALAALNIKSGEIKILTVTKRGADLIAPAGWNVEVLERPSGIRWNGRNTAYRVNSPENYVVIANVYPNEKDTRVAQKNKQGKTVYVTQRTIKYDLYAPYSPDLHTSDLVISGQNYTKNMVAKAMEELKFAGVKSKAIPKSLVTDVFASKNNFFERIPLLEQTDLTEFEIDPKNTVERAHVIIGANQDKAFNTTCNSSSACGWVQFTPRTYAAIAKSYPSAKLIKDFKAGAADHLNSMKAAILLYDTNLKDFINIKGLGVLNDPSLEEYLASSYNGAPRHAKASLKAAILGGIQDWVQALSSKKGGIKDETRGYLVKLRWLQQNEAPLAAVANS